jgi:D-alanyl-D-alanine carboxypeptidase/D-alanyl-D-alanine-endopeptidase (penicillin-binding protein 4)
MKNIFLIALFIFFANAEAKSTPSFNAKLHALIKSVDSNISYSVIIADSKSKKILYQQNAKQNFLPASTLKLFTAFAGLNYLGSNYQYRTELLAEDNKPPDNFTYQGNIILKFTGDPSLTIDDLDNLIKAISEKGIHKINGSLFIDDLKQDQVGWSVGTVLEDTKFCFSAPVTAIIINKNCVSAEATLMPDKKIKLSSPETEFVNFDNRLNYSTAPALANLIAHENNQYLLTGHIADSMHLQMAIQNNRLFCKKIISALLTKYQIEMTQGIHFEKSPQSTVSIASHLSPPLSDLMTTMLKESDNLIANAIFKTIDHTTSNNNQSWSSNSLLVKKLIAKKLHINTSEISIADGSGASIYNLIKPIHLISLLNYLVDNHPNFLTMLPHAGVDGTLKNRMTDPKIEVYAKTGTETGISSLAGYLVTHNKRKLSFVIMINHGLHDRRTYKSLEDKICYLIYHSF